MGMYTELNIAIRLKKTTPPEVIETLQTMVKGEGSTSIQHRLFSGTERWPWMLKSGGSTYFEAEPYVHFAEKEYSEGEWGLALCTNIKNYDKEWQLFLDWLAPYIEVGGVSSYIGTYRYEEDLVPSLIFANGETVTMVTPNKTEEALLERVRELERLAEQYLERLAG